MPVQSVKKALTLLDVLLFDDPGREGVSLSTLAQRMGWPLNSTHNLLKSMAECGYVEQNGEGHYRTGPKCLRIGRLNQMTSAEEGRRIRELVAESAATLGETCVFATLVEGRRIVLATVDGGGMVKIDHAMMQDVNLYNTPTGRVLLAWTDEEERMRTLERNGFPGPFWDGIEDTATLGAALETVRSTEICQMTTQGEVTSFATPVRDESGALLGALGCYAPAFRCGPDRVEAIRNHLLAQAAKAGKTL